ncbi:myeloid cell surface antigen CD33-like [Dendropsophus ebraccatus]|uniref:myeloid cell surface antigen CD33-like n=1 Tax=Dendropsophus ebraccatus TaxID=150705 RepID=UPI0038316DD9
MWVSLVVILPLLWKGITSLPGYTIQVSPSVSVQEGLCVTIPCNFTADNRNTFSNTTGYWRRMPLHTGDIVATNDKSSDVKKPNFYLKGNPDSGDCTLTITDAGREDEGEYYFRFEESKDSPVKYNYYGETTTAITVTDLTEEPVISDLGTVTAGIDKTVTCSPPGNCSAASLVIQWKKSDVSGIWKNTSTITFTPSPDDHQKTITCEMTNSRGNTTKKTILLDVSSNMTTSDTSIYWYIAVAIICGIIILITLTALLYKFVIRKKMTKKTIYESTKELSAGAEPPTDEIYVNANKSKQKKETENNIQVISSDVSLDQDGLHYSSVSFTVKPSKVPSSQPETEYAEVKRNKT